MDNDVTEYEIKRKSRAAYDKISFYILYHINQKNIVKKIIKELDNYELIFKSDISEFNSYYEKRATILNEVTYMVVLVSRDLLYDWTLMRILDDNYYIGEKNNRIIPLIIEEWLYKPIEKNKMIKDLQKEIDEYEKECFDGNYNGDTAEELRNMQRILETVKGFVNLSLDRNKIMDKHFSKKIRDYIKYDSKMDVKLKKEENGKENRNMTVIVNGGQANIANGNSTIHATQNNGINANELDNIIKGIMENVSDLQQEDADKIIDAVEMAKEELTKTEPRANRLKSCLALIAPLFTIANGIPTLASNLQKLQEFINLHIH